MSQDTFSQAVLQKEEYKKILAIWKKAREDSPQYALVDTFCIDKTSSAELSEAINSMCRQYK